MVWIKRSAQPKLIIVGAFYLCLVWVSALGVLGRGYDLGVFKYLFIYLFSQSCFLNVHPRQRMAIYCLDYPVVVKIT